MSQLLVSDPAAAQRFVERIELPGAPERAREASSDDGLPASSYEANTQQAVVVGSQIAEFAARVPLNLRPQISNSFLLAQLAANKQLSGGGDSQAWYSKYCEVLANTGWVMETNAFNERDVAGSTLQVHKEILPVIVAALGPAAATAAIITAALDGLEKMSRDSPWITLFQSREPARQREPIPDRLRRRTGRPGAAHLDGLL